MLSGNEAIATSVPQDLVSAQAVDQVSAKAVLEALRMACNGRFEVPEVVSFSAKAPTVSEAMTFTGNF